MSAPVALSAFLEEAPGVRVISSDEVLRDHTQDLPTGDLLFQDAAGTKIRLITTTADPEIQNPGDGSFYPIDEQTVVSALRRIPVEFLAPLKVQIYLLPFPRAGMLSSSADSLAIYLSPGVRPYSADQVHFLVAHEIGHCVHRRFLPDSDEAGWSAWALLRGTGDTRLYNAAAPHAQRPHEIFAEDFRVLFGGDLARGDGSIENRDLTLPEAVPGLPAYYQNLIGMPAALVAAAEWRIGPNPLRLGQVLTLSIPAEYALRGGPELHLLDVAGRSVADPRAASLGSGRWSVSLQGQDRSGRTLPAGAYWLRVEGAGSKGAEKTLPIRILR